MDVDDVRNKCERKDEKKLISDEINKIKKK